MLDKTKERATAKKWRAANKEKVRGYNQKAYAKLPEGYQAAQSRKWRAANPEKKATEFEKYKQKHPNWFKKQTTRRTTEPTPQRRPCLDHCHETNRFRGWLCSNCNISLGLAGDSPEGVRKLLDYIVRAYAMLDLRILR